MLYVTTGKFLLDDRGKAPCPFEGQREGVRKNVSDKKMTEPCLEKLTETH